MMAIVTAVALLVLYGMSLPAVVDYVTFMKVQSTAYLKIRFDWLFSIYVIFAVAVLIRYAWILWWALRGRGPERLRPDQGELGRMTPMPRTPPPRPAARRRRPGGRPRRLAEAPRRRRARASVPLAARSATCAGRHRRFPAPSLSTRTAAGAGTTLSGSRLSYGMKPY